MEEGEYLGQAETDDIIEKDDAVPVPEAGQDDKSGKDACWDLDQGILFFVRLVVHGEKHRQVDGPVLQFREFVRLVDHDRHELRPDFLGEIRPDEFDLAPAQSLLIDDVDVLSG